MINIREVAETNKMIEQENLDVRTITLGISLLDCIDSDLEKLNEKIYSKITTVARDLVAVGQKIENSYCIPIVNKRISVTPIALIGGAACKTPDDFVTIAHTLDRAAKKAGVNFIGGYSALVSKGMTQADENLIRSIPAALAETDFVCSSVNVGSTKTGIDIDADGFVYASNFDAGGTQAVRRLNPKGEDVIRKGENENVGGDIKTTGTSDYSGVTTVVDVVYRDKGIYSLLDSKRGRIFTYDHEGNLLYIFGGLGTQAGTFTTPVAIEAIGDKIIVLDSYRKEMLVFTQTQYGDLINRAVGLRYDGDETQAVDLWKLPNRKLRKYMFNYLEIITVVSTIMLIRSGTQENLEKKRELWKYLKEYDLRLFWRLRNGIMGHAMNLPGRGGRKISVAAYKISQKVVGFN